MGLSAAEKNRRKRERKKKEKEERRKRELEEKEAQAALQEKGDTINGADEDEDEIVIEYVVEDLSKILNSNNNFAKKEETTQKDPDQTSLRPDGLPPVSGSDPEKDKASAAAKQQEEADNSIEEVLRRFHQRALVVAPTSGKNEDDDQENNDQSSVVSDDYSSDDDSQPKLSRRKLKDLHRPTVAELKRRVQRPDLVEAHDVAAADPHFLIELKAISHTTPVPFHWGRKRKYLQGKRGFDKVPFKLPDFIIKTGITDVRDTAMEDEAAASAKQKNRGRINPKMGSMDVDYKILYDAFFKYQTKPEGLTSWGDLYYEGKEMENSTDIKPGGPFSRGLRIALGMDDLDTDESATPPPWLWNMQRYGPPPGHPKLKIPGLNAPLPNIRCRYGYHPGGWGKPPVDVYNRPLYGGNPLDPPGIGNGNGDVDHRELVTSDGKTVLKVDWGGLPVGEDLGGGGDGDDSGADMEGSSSDEDSSSAGSADGMEESESEDDGDNDEGKESVLPPPPPPSGGIDNLRKQSAGDETPAPPQKRLYQVLETGEAAAAPARGAGSSIFQSDVRYVVPGSTTASAATVPEGAESVLSKAMAPSQHDPDGARKKRKINNQQDDDDDELEKNFKF